MKKEAYVRLREAEDRHFWFTGMHELILSFAAKHSGGGQDARILDAGCGTGGLLLRLGALGHAEGIDFSEEALRFCRERGLENAARKDLNDWNPPAAAFDIITCVDVLYHKSILNDAEVLGKFHKALKPSGLLLLNVPAFEVLRRNHDEEVATGRRYRKKQLLTLLQNAGFETGCVTYRLPALFFALLAGKAAARPCAAGSGSRHLRLPPPVLNRLLLGMHRLENRWISSGRTFPVGSSLFAAVRKL